MSSEDPSLIIESTLDHLSATRAYAEAFRGDIVDAFRSDTDSEELLYMKDRVEKFLKQIDLYESIFVSMKDAYFAVKVEKRRAG
ncbi:MAG: hypothetical protein ACTJLK_00780 [Anaplasma sp.]